MQQKIRASMTTTIYLAILHIVITLCLIICVALSLVSVSTHHWVNVPHENVIQHKGLWKYCHMRGCERLETYFEYHDEEYPEWMNIVRATCCLATICFVFTLVYHAVTCVKPYGVKHNYIIAACILISGFLHFVGMGLYTRNYDSKKSTWGWSFYVGWATFFASLATFSISFLYSKTLSKELEKLKQQEKIMLEDDEVLV